METVTNVAGHRAADPSPLGVELLYPRLDRRLPRTERIGARIERGPSPRLLSDQRADGANVALVADALLHPLDDPLDLRRELTLRLALDRDSPLPARRVPRVHDRPLRLTERLLGSRRDPARV